MRSRTFYGYDPYNSVDAWSQGWVWFEGPRGYPPMVLDGNGMLVEE